ncbi:MAG: 5-(carboxyamino)imidazole ribonucleotide mutase [Elusimicrobiaceae bacterium]|jgi:5-(carboxyamino)imidazole ribonucleotide mutase|nr:5-(carboxyamino)imidazole ribonucleotide mutase [Elusimicrobiaceae bacterium]MBT3955112.1 5-(carboxyamino)imidazole ribonucleotide mutase [Elusimicrobiaceae bacterium]MBT4008019.1 5-(carboxyamino)imidazole ribonucleotide mutase [Elusimicrobiaceae bacterium]MBT4403201.1 5-(carboxyamino)imidazole ribonucleotide mutase [Elusimicrobiaceae bacterium]MBT4440356.1 5-(carboxyamino)imidazole ribonucleotide mutase [Elusimicrobiaceae bacterium]
MTVKNKKVLIVMGSDSDMPVMQKASDVLKEFGVEFAIKIASAHRSPNFTHKLIKEAEEGGVEVFIAGAGMAAHLAGVVASVTVKPVIGVPIASGKLEGEDALYSTVQMPSGIPVATVAIDGAKNAGYLAISILATCDEDLNKKLLEYRKAQEEKIIEKNK